MIVATAALLGCASAGEAKKKVQPLAGSWGGNHAGLTLTPEGGTLAYDCAAGSIDEPLVPNSIGEFSVRGTHTPGTGGPVQQGVEPQSYDATYQGSVKAQTITFRVIVRSTGLVMGPLTLRKDAPAVLMRCL
jgi:hypothetical protein